MSLYLGIVLGYLVGYYLAPKYAREPVNWHCAFCGKPDRSIGNGRFKRT